MPLCHPVHRLSCCLLLSGSLLLGGLLASSAAQVSTAIRPDGTLGTAVTKTGNVYNIMGGTRPGNGPNLFHSFDHFSVGTNDTASFSGPMGIANILSRVTGGQQSLIDGKLHSAIPGANLYLLNPSGVLFGPNASLEISGSFHVSTADYLRLTDGARFSARLSDTSTLSVAPPEAFGFLGPHPASIAVQGSALHVPAGASLSLVGGDIRITGSSPTDFENPTLAAPSGRVLLTSVAAPGEVRLAAAGQPLAPDVSTFTRLGTVVIEQGALIDASGNGGGTVSMRGGRLQVDNAFVFADTKPGGLSGAALGIDMHVTGEVVVTNGSFITSDTLGAGNAGEIRISAGSLRLADSVIGSSSSQDGHAGAVEVTARDITLTDGAQIASSTSGPGKGGAVRVTATDTLTLSGTAPGGAFLSGILANAEGEGVGAGAAGTVVVEARDVTLTDGAQIVSATFGPGQGGSVRVTATDTLTLTGTHTASGRVFPSGILANAQGQEMGAGAAGTVVVEARDVTLTDGAQIVSATFGPGRGGSVRVTATDTLTLTGTHTASGRVFPSGILANAQGQEMGAGAAGTVVVEARDVTLIDGAQIVSATFGPGQGGSVRVTATDTLTLTGTHTASGRVFPSGILANAQGQEMGAGAAGTVVVEARDVTLTDGAQIVSATFGPGRGGSVRVTATDTLTLTGTHTASGRVFPSGILANAQGQEMGAGAAGTVVVEARDVTLIDGARISSTTSGPGQGGTVTVTAADTLTLAGQGSGLLTGTTGSGQGGDLVLQARQLQLTDEATISANSAAAGNAGSITIRAAALSLSAQSTITTGAAMADGGNIQIIAQDMLRLRDSQITTAVSSGQGRGGNILIDPTFVLLERSQIRADAFGGPGGNISLVADVFLADPASRVSASSALNVPGTIDIQAAVTNLSGVVAPLTPDFVRATELLRDRCAARLREGTVSSFVVRGRASQPATYEGPLPSRLYEPQQPSPSTGASQLPRETTISPQGQRNLDRAEQVQAPGGSTLSIPPLVLTLSCAR